MINENEILEKAHDAVLELPFDFNLTVKPKGFWHKLLIKLKIKPKVVTLSISPTGLGSRVWYSKFLVGVELTKKDLEEETTILNHNATIAYTERMAKAVAAAIHNENSHPPQWLVDSILLLPSNQFLFLVDKLQGYVNTADFLNSIILLTGMSLNKQEEIIASTQTRGK